MIYYRIVRHFSDGRPRKRGPVYPTREEAQKHCSQAYTRGVLRSGVKWFDGFEQRGKEPKTCQGVDHAPNPGQIVSGGGLCVECGKLIRNKKAATI